MRACFQAAAALVLCTAAAAHAHRLDEYLQATTIALEQNRLRVEIRMIPGVYVWPKVLARIDTDKDGELSAGEVEAYAARLHRDISLAVNGKALSLRLTSSAADETQLFERGLGELRFRFVADVPLAGERHRLAFENRHQRAIASYLVNCLAPADPGIRITAQRRDHRQSRYQLDYVSRSR